MAAGLWVALERANEGQAGESAEQRDVQGAITLKQARDKLKGDWREAYKQYYGQPSA